MHSILTATVFSELSGNPTAIGKGVRAVVSLSLAGGFTVLTDEFSVGLLIIWHSFCRGLQNLCQ